MRGGEAGERTGPILAGVLLARRSRAKISTDKFSKKNPVTIKMVRGFVSADRQCRIGLPVYFNL